MARNTNIFIVFPEEAGHKEKRFIRDIYKFKN